MAKLAEERGKVSGRTSFSAAKEGDKQAQEVVAHNKIQHVDNLRIKLFIGLVVEFGANGSYLQ